MNIITKSLLQKQARRCVLHHPIHSLVVPTSSSKTWNESSANYREDNDLRHLHYCTTTVKKSKFHDESTTSKTPISSLNNNSVRVFPQQCHFFRETTAWKDSNLSFYSFCYFSRRNFSSFGKTEYLREKASISNDGASQPPKDKDSSASSTDSSDSPVTKKERLQNAAQRGKAAVSKGALSIRGLIQKYGWTFVGTYMGLYFVTLGSLFISVDSGLIDPVTITSIEWPWHSSGVEDGTGATSTTSSSDQKDFDSAVEFVASYMKKFPWTAPYSDFVLRNPHLANLGIAWVATKLTEPIRLPVSIAIVRKIKKDVDDV
eukprot:CAMPEP_0176501498 /NCGR_PEP_ID=MMETSP0200_2-20121128/14190_1 /TAXON_ID=947934 /ORGANISM="Chaetoceros sp., Strain GSL56" /LENGTH=316 /DNA_ID=CAMNT_0017900383 /DNA_START=80 /DNA_END=1030 /DNA_ORIENTATION=+